MHVLLIFMTVAVAAAHHCNEFQCAFFDGKKHTSKAAPGMVDKTSQPEDDLVHRHDMHSFTGAEGINHQTPDSGITGRRSRQGGHKSVAQTNNNLVLRRELHSFTGSVGINHGLIDQDCKKRRGKLFGFKTSDSMRKEETGELNPFRK